MFYKICGITRQCDLDVLLKTDASAVGFIAYPKSPRFIHADKVDTLISSIEKTLYKVGVFVNPDINDIILYLSAGIDVIQLHGNESADFASDCARFADVWKALAPKTEEDVLKYIDYPADKFIIDAFSSDYGGTGKKADWNLAKFAVKHLKKPVILAGGINIDNIENACKEVKPFGIDLSSGVEDSPGIKNKELIQKINQKISL